MANDPLDPWGEPEPPDAVQEAPAKKVTVTLKGGSGYDAPWIVIHATDVEDALAQLASAKTKELTDLAARVGQYFAGTGKALGGQNSGAAANQTPTAQPSRTEPPNGKREFCEHGEMTYREGVGKASGKAFKGYFCSLKDQDQQCDAKFVR